jgi:hypothetical protein
MQAPMVTMDRETYRKQLLELYDQHVRLLALFETLTRQHKQTIEALEQWAIDHDDAKLIRSLKET